MGTDLVLSSLGLKLGSQGWVALFHRDKGDFWTGEVFELSGREPFFEDSPALWIPFPFDRVFCLFASSIIFPLMRRRFDELPPFTTS
ncbi:hypothetical protein R1flu_018889 [Riccia fluitans]|uniref:Uncharacterized protein n=1 Tax=Riccia fluitans TaxID=41844 RepID=A0ABD1ZH44_9MARC